MKGSVSSSCSCCGYRLCTSHALVRTQDLIVLVASGCGLGVHRGPLDGCTPINDGYFARYYRGYRNAYYVGPVTGGVCGGRGTHIACNYYEICWVACN